MPWLSVVMPVRNEAAGIVQALAPLQGLRGQIEIIVVDGGSADGTVELAGPLADQVIESAPGRARQMNAGAALACGEVLLFLHADTQLPEGFEGMIRSAIPATHNVTPASHAVIPASHAVIPAKAGIHFDLQPTPSPEQDSSAHLNPTMDPRVREDDGREESVIPAEAGIHSGLQPTPSPERDSSAHLNPTMDPRVREDDGREESVIPAEAGIHSDPQPTPGPERDSLAHLNPTMDPRVREDDGCAERRVSGLGTAAPTHLVIPAHAGIHFDFGSQSHWGRFDVRLAPSSSVLNLVAWMMNHRSRLTGICTGDQAIFVRRDLFNRLGGYADIPLMEDIDLSKRLKRISPPACIRPPLTTSSRRWQKHGVFRTIALMWWLRLQYWAGVSPARLAQKYYPARQNRT